MRTWRCLVMVPGIVGIGAAVGSSQAPTGNAHQAPLHEVSSVATGGERVIAKPVTVSASLTDVWAAWTTTAGVTSFGPPQANVELRVGGPYEWYFAPKAPEGSRGSEGCRVLSFLPRQMLSFTWNAPPSIPELRGANVHTHVVTQFEDLEDGRVEVSLSPLGLGEGKEWDEYYDYFTRAWPRVLTRFQGRSA